MALTPFDVDKYRKGQPVQTREGLAVNNLREAYYPEIDTTYLTAVIAGKPYMWDIGGARDYLFGTPDPYDLFMDDPIEYKWVLPENIIDDEPVDPGAYYVVKVISEPL